LQVDPVQVARGDAGAARAGQRAGLAIEFLGGGQRAAVHRRLQFGLDDEQPAEIEADRHEPEQHEQQQADHDDDRAVLAGVAAGG
jgi:hypothetical protein